MAHYHLHATHHGRDELYVLRTSRDGIWNSPWSGYLVVLYKRLVLGEPRRTLPTDLEKHGHEKVVDIYTSGGEGKSSS